MLFSNTFESVYVLLALVVLVRVLLNGSNLAAFVSLSLTCLLSFTFFESSWPFSPLAFFFLKDYILLFFASLKTYFFKLKNSLFFGNKEEEKVTVLLMKGKEKASFVPEGRANPGNVQVQSSNSQDTPSVPVKDDQITISFPAPSERVREAILSTVPTLVDYTFIAGYIAAVFHGFVGGSLQLYTVHGHTIEGRRFADRRVAAMALFSLAFLAVTKWSGNGLGDFAKRALEPLLDASTPIEKSPENQDRLKDLDQKLAGLLTSQVYLATSVSGDFLEVSGAKTTEFIFICLKAFDQLLKDGKIDLDLNGLENLGKNKLICLIEGYKALPSDGKLFVKEHCDKLYLKIVEIDELVSELATLDLVNSNERQSSFSLEQDDVPTAPKPPMAPLKITTLGELPDPENPERTVGRSIEQQGDNISPLSSHGSFSTTFGPGDYLRGIIKQRQEEVGRGEGLIENYPRYNSNRPSSSEIEGTQGNSSRVAGQLDSPGRSPGSRHEPLGIFSDQDDTNPPIQHNSSETQLVPKRSSSLNSDHYGFSASVLENLEKGRYLQWIGCGFCAATLLTTNQIALAVLRNLNYTQDLVKKLTDKGFPKFLFFWIRHPNPRWVGEKPLFRLMVGILVGNFIVLYLLVKMIYLLP